MRFRTKGAVAAASALIIVGGVVIGESFAPAHSARATVVATGVQSGLSSADQSARSALESGIVADGQKHGGLLRSVSGVTIKGSTWGEFITLSGYSFEISNPTLIAPLSTPVYVEIAQGDIAFDEPTPANPSPQDQPWMLTVIDASSSPFRPLFRTVADPGVTEIPGWFTSMSDESVSPAPQPTAP